MPREQSPASADWLQSVIQNFINDSPENTLNDTTNEKAWINPLVGFSKGDDPLYNAYKEYVGPFHWTPEEIFTLTFSETTVNPEDLTVISWILPQTEPAKSDNRKKKNFPSERWARARLFGEEVNDKLRRHIVALLQKKGHASIAPVLSPLWSQKTSERYGFASTWSERHAAYASGLGTFGLSDGLITERGKAMRTGSVVAHIRIPPTPRPYDSHHAYCLFFTQNVCGKCILRCPAGAITEEGHDKMKCFSYCYKTSKDYIKSHYGLDVGACGLCQTKVPCESNIPVKADI